MPVFQADFLSRLAYCMMKTIYARCRQRDPTRRSDYLQALRHRKNFRMDFPGLSSRWNWDWKWKNMVKLSRKQHQNQYGPPPALDPIVFFSHCTFISRNFLISRDCIQEDPGRAAFIRSIERWHFQMKCEKWGNCRGTSIFDRQVMNFFAQRIAMRLICQG